MAFEFKQTEEEKKKLAPHLAAASRNSTTELVADLRGVQTKMKEAPLSGLRKLGVLCGQAADKIEELTRGQR